MFAPPLSDPGSRSATPTLMDKGKGREPDSTLSTESVLANDTPEKPPVHPYEVSGHSIPPSSVNIQEVPPSDAASNHDAPNPPLAELDPPTQPTPSLTGDVVAFLGMISTMFAQNPPLTTSLRGIMQNVASLSFHRRGHHRLGRVKGFFEHPMYVSQLLTVDPPYLFCRFCSYVSC